MTSPTRGLEKSQAIVQHILRHIGLPRRRASNSRMNAVRKPLIVGISGPQGIGKTTITNQLVSTLTSAPHNLRVFTFSMDDLYLPFKDQAELSRRHPDNKLIEFRGLPGTHDIQLGTQILQALCEANRDSTSTRHVPVPSYDKALNAGRGDQVPREDWVQAEGPFDVVLFEGWSLGFKSIRDKEQLAKIVEQAHFPPLYLAKHSFQSLSMINTSLGDYEREWYQFLDIFVHLSAPNLSTIFQWRAEQERDLWRRKGMGMTEVQVEEFVSRFMPAYELYLENLKSTNLFKSSAEKEVKEESVTNKGRHLRLNLDKDRALVSSELVE